MSCFCNCRSSAGGLSLTWSNNQKVDDAENNSENQQSYQSNNANEEWLVGCPEKINFLLAGHICTGC